MESELLEGGGYLAARAAFASDSAAEQIHIGGNESSRTESRQDRQPLAVVFEDPCDAVEQRAGEREDNQRPCKGAEGIASAGSAQELDDHSNACCYHKFGGYLSKTHFSYPVGIYVLNSRV